MHGWVLYDGGCGVCARWVPFWAPTLKRLDLDIAPLQAPWVAERLGLAPETLLRDLRLVLDDGRQLVGADAYRFVMARLWWARPLGLLAGAPGLRDVFDAGYRAFADSRLGISHACGLNAPGTPANPNDTNDPNDIIQPFHEAEQYHEFECYYCNDLQTTSNVEDYEKHVISKHGLGHPCYPCKLDLERLGIKAQGKSWEI